MSVREAHEDLFESGMQTLVVTINLEGAMGAGVALRAREMVPMLYTT